MLCKLARSKIYQYVDAELPVDMLAPFEEHLRSCPECRHRVELETRFRQAYIAPLTPEVIPQEVRERISRFVTDLGNEAKPRGHHLRDLLPRRRVWVAALALMLIGGFAGALVTRFPGLVGDSWLGLADASVEQHRKLVQAQLPYDIKTASPKEAERWFKQRMEFNVTLPELKGDRMTLLGGRVSRLEDFDVAALGYRVDHQNVSLFIFPIERYRRYFKDDSGARFKIANRQGYDVIIWSGHGSAYSLVSGIGGRSCLVCHSPEEKLDPVLHPSPHSEGGASALRLPFALEEERSIAP